MTQGPDPDATLRTLRALVAAFNAHDLDASMAFFADDAVLQIPPGGPDAWGARLPPERNTRISDVAISFP